MDTEKTTRVAIACLTALVGVVIIAISMANIRTEESKAKAVQTCLEQGHDAIACGRAWACASGNAYVCNDEN